MKTHSARCSAERYTTQYFDASFRGCAHLKELDRLLIRSFLSLFLFSRSIMIRVSRSNAAALAATADAPPEELSRTRKSNKRTTPETAADAVNPPPATETKKSKSKKSKSDPKEGAPPPPAGSATEQPETLAQQVLRLEAELVVLRAPPSDEELLKKKLLALQAEKDAFILESTKKAAATSEDSRRVTDKVDTQMLALAGLDIQLLTEQAKKVAGTPGITDTITDPKEKDNASKVGTRGSVSFHFNAGIPRGGLALIEGLSPNFISFHFNTGIPRGGLALIEGLAPNFISFQCGDPPWWSSPYRGAFAEFHFISIVAPRGTPVLSDCAHFVYTVYSPSALLSLHRQPDPT